MATLVEASGKEWTIKFANQSDMADAKSGTPVIIKPEWKDPE
jgi:hypothetical protein